MRRGNTDKQQTAEKPVFFTNIEVENNKDNKDEVSNKVSDLNTNVNRETKSARVIKRPNRFYSDTGYDINKNAAKSNNLNKQPVWMKRKKGPKFLLDFRRNKNNNVDNSQDGNPTSIEKLRMMHYNQQLPNRETYFIPKLKGPRNPQLAKIKAYFVEYSNIV